MSASSPLLPGAAHSDRQKSSPALTRQLLEQDKMGAMVAIDAPGLKLLTDAERIASLQQMLATRPPGDLWVFGYGSLVWNAAINTVERRIARIDGWHRSFCLAITALRATADRPGLMLALDKGGSCHGAAYRLAEESIERELQLLWRREMLCGAYVPLWVEVRNLSGEPFGWAIAFTINADGPQYAGHLDEETVVRQLATASGGLGSAADYLFKTHHSLSNYGIHDARLARLSGLVKALHANGQH